MKILASGKHGLWLWMLMSMLNSAASQLDGYVSVDCGATASSTDSVTGIEWTTDESYINTGIIANVKSLPPSGVVNEQQLRTLRYFSADRRKSCYTLPASRNSSYLLRAMFYHGAFEPATKYSFDVSIDSTLADSLTVPEVDTAYYVEYMVAAISNRIDFCLMPKMGNAFISTLELRPLADEMYDVVFNGRYLRMIDRLNFGVLSTHPVVRYPDDIYDRFWLSPPENPDVTDAETVSKIDVLTYPFDRPPLAVMQSAWVGTESISWITPIGYDLSETTFYISEFLAEVEEIGATDTRIVDITMNDVYQLNDTITDAAGQVYVKGLTLSQKSVNITFTANPLSTLGPLLNAAEIYASRKAVTDSTNEGDVNVLEVVKSNLGLSSWTGDPCLPVTYNWLTCESGPTPRITKITLSRYDLSGTIPASIAELTALTDLWLDNNNIIGTIPDLRNLKKLKTLHLQNNSLNGSIPSTLASLPVLTELLLSNNNLSGPIPADLANRNGLKLETFGNDKLCSPTENCDDGGGGGGGGGSSGGLIGGIVSGAIAGLAIIGIGVWYYRRKHAKPTPTVLPTINPKIHQTGASKGSKVSLSRSGAAAVNQAREFTLAEVQEATDGYINKIGEGGFGPVYHGKLSDGTELAVKINSETSGQGLTEFTNEVSFLSRVHHRNLVSLLGYCEEDGQQILIYEFMPNGTLRDHLYGKDMKGKLSWRTRLDIALNAAKGLEYLHNDCVPKVIHRDVKTNNILLDGKFMAKVADFGISKLAQDEGQTDTVTTVVRGTPGYLDPEYYQHNRLTHKSDVYSFGVVLLEIMCGRPPNSPNQADPRQYNLIDWARRQLNGSDLESIVDPAIRGTYSIEAMWKVAELAMGCVEPHGNNRPDMKHVVRGLTVASELEAEKTQTFRPGGNAMVGGGYGTTASDYPSTFNTETYESTQSSGVTSIPEYPTVSGEHGENPLFNPPGAFVRVPSDKRDSGSSRFAPKPR